MQQHSTQISSLIPAAGKMQNQTNPPQVCVFGSIFGGLQQILEAVQCDLRSMFTYSHWKRHLERMASLLLDIYTLLHFNCD
jgi:hypothetical protein